MASVEAFLADEHGTLLPVVLTEDRGGGLPEVVVCGGRCFVWERWSDEGQPRYRRATAQKVESVR